MQKPFIYFRNLFRLLSYALRHGGTTLLCLFHPSYTNSKTRQMYIREVVHAMTNEIPICDSYETTFQYHSLAMRYAFTILRHYLLGKGVKHFYISPYHLQIDERKKILVKGTPRMKILEEIAKQCGFSVTFFKTENVYYYTIDF